MSKDPQRLTGSWHAPGLPSVYYRELLSLGLRQRQQSVCMAAMNALASFETAVGAIVPADSAVGSTADCSDFIPCHGGVGRFYASTKNSALRILLRADTCKR